MRENNGRFGNENLTFNINILATFAVIRLLCNYISMFSSSSGIKILNELKDFKN